MDWSQDTSDVKDNVAAAASEVKHEDPAPVKKKGTYKIITNYLESGKTIIRTALS